MSKLVLGIKSVCISMSGVDTDCPTLAGYGVIHILFQALQGFASLSYPTIYFSFYQSGSRVWYS